LVLRDDFLKENIDGEALAWAYRRSLSAPAARRRILVVSDGVPMDDSTCSENPSNYLERHLHEVIGAIEGAGVVHLAALGMDFTLDRFYRHSGVWFAEEGQDGFALAWRLITGDF
jgi:cobaltochelatase CobT